MSSTGLRLSNQSYEILEFTAKGMNGARERSWRFIDFKRIDTLYAAKARTLLYKGVHYR